MAGEQLSNAAAVVSLAPEISKVLSTAAVAIKTTEHYEQAADCLRMVKGLLKQIEDIRTGETQPLNARLRDINQQAKDISAPLVAAEAKLKNGMSAYSKEQEKLRVAEQARLDEKARKDQQRLEQRAQKAEADGKVEKAAALTAQAGSVVAPIVNRAPPKVSGISTRKVWKFEVTDPALVPREYLLIDETKIRKVVQALKEDTTIPGVRVWPEDQIAAGAA